METRCGKCKKLYRVADEKITGRGIKFSCTQCGDTVKITREEFDAYTLSKTAVSALDMFEPKTKTGAPSIIEPAAAKAAEETPDSDAIGAHAPLSAPKDLEQSSYSIPDFLQEREEHAFSEPKPFEELSVGDALQPEKNLPSEVDTAVAIPANLELEEERGGPIELEEEKKPGYHTVPAIDSQPQQTIPPEPEQIQEQEREMAPALDLVHIYKPETMSQPNPEESVTQTQEPEAEPAIHATPAPTSAEVPPATPIEEFGEMVMEQSGHETPQTKPSRTGRMVLILMSTLILVGVGGYGVYKFVLPSLQNAGQPSPEVTSIEGLRIANPSGSVEPNGDLLITGSVENLTDKEQSAWYVIADVYDAKGNVLNKIRLLNGNQIYSRADYAVLSKRGVNVTELKAKILQNQGVAIPAKGSVSFEMRYMQPPIGIASFNAVLKPFEPTRLLKEIAEETK